MACWNRAFQPPRGAKYQPQFGLYSSRPLRFSHRLRGAIQAAVAGQISRGHNPPLHRWSLAAGMMHCIKLCKLQARRSETEGVHLSRGAVLTLCGAVSNIMPG
ncbi:hypothetical protein Mal33_41100 [Rosistilla oblonga]|uniref:Uncharacterized protein n=1 Tax=Rosistilla oblonga TaxID=2527990 RepID=A0A518IYC8_9BACT|nr:hypothetical protein Mal33_41100 [Rosistilla oblonga]